MKRVVIIVPEGDIHVGSVYALNEILSWANTEWQKAGHRSMINIQLAGVTGSKLHSGLFTVDTASIYEIENPHLLIIPSINIDYENILKQNDELVKWIKLQYKNGTEIVSVCTGAFLLAATGLLDGKVCSTHWHSVDDFKKMFPKVRVDTNVLTITNGIYTNGGGYSFLNITLFLVEKFFDRQTAILASKTFQVDIDRTSQLPFEVFRAKKNHSDEMINRAQDFIEKHLDERISFETLASELSLSRRNFDRRFIKATGSTPVKYLQHVKIEVAKSELEGGRKTIPEIMDDIGYSDDKAFRAVFKKITGMSPSKYKLKYNKQLPIN